MTKLRPTRAADIQVGMRFEWPDTDHAKNPSTEKIWEVVQVSDEYEWDGKRVDNWRRNYALAAPVGHQDEKLLLSFPDNPSGIHWL